MTLCPSLTASSYRVPLTFVRLQTDYGWKPVAHPPSCPTLAPSILMKGYASKSVDSWSTRSRLVRTPTPLQTGLRFRDGHMSDVVYPWKEGPRKGFVQSLEPFGQRLHLGKEFQGLKGGVHALGEHVSLSHGCKRTWKGASLPKAQGPSQFPLRPGLSMAFLPQPNILKATSTFAFLNSHHGLSKPAAITSH